MVLGELAKMRICTRFGRRKWSISHYSGRITAFRYADGQTQGCLEHPSLSSLSALRQLFIPTAGLADQWLPKAYLQMCGCRPREMEDTQRWQYPKALSISSPHGLAMMAGYAWFLGFPCHSNLSTYPGASWLLLTLSVILQLPLPFQAHSPNFSNIRLWWIL